MSSRAILIVSLINQINPNIAIFRLKDKVQVELPVLPKGFTIFVYVS